MIRLHLIAPFHTVPTLDASHCAFTGKVLRFAKMMKGTGVHVIEYANEGSTSEAPEKVPILTPDEVARFYPRKPEDFWGNHAIIGSAGYTAFCAKLLPALTARVVPREDIIGHPFGPPHKDLVQVFSNNVHVETGIGYTDGPIGGLRIYESETWRHLHWGKYNEYAGQTQSKDLSWVIPNYFDLSEWPIVPEGPSAPRYVFLGRVCDVKGVPVLVAIAKEWFRRWPSSPATFTLAGQGDWKPYADDLGELASSGKVTHIGPITGPARAAFLGNATCSIMPSKFVEPFGGSGVEGMLCGTPLVASDYGAFVETVIPGRTGYRCKTLADWITALQLASGIARRGCAETARQRYSLEACAPLYVRAFQEALDYWNGAGWYTPESRAPWAWSDAGAIGSVAD